MGCGIFSGILVMGSGITGLALELVSGLIVMMAAIRFAGRFLPAPRTYKIYSVRLCVTLVRYIILVRYLIVRYCAFEGDTHECN